MLSTGVKTKSMRRFMRDFGRAQDGAIAVMLTAIVGIIALAVELGRAWNLETELQHAADACALSGATQLDGTDGARVRAIQTCLGQIVRNQQKFASDGLGADVTFDTVVSIGGDGTADNRDIIFFSAIEPAYVEAISDFDARFVEANVFPRRVDFSFAAAIGAVDSALPRARALAGWESFFCDTPPMMMCNPAEPDGGDASAPFDLYQSCADLGDGDPSCVGRGIAMKTKGGGGKLNPGDWGYLELQVYNAETGVTESVKGAAGLKDALSSVEYDAVCTGNQITTQPGNIASLDIFINMRMDLYKNDPPRTEPNRQPARNVAKGLVLPDTWDGTADGCWFNPLSSVSAPSGDWQRPVDKYKGPGRHIRDLSSGGTPVFDSFGEIRADANGMGIMSPAVRAASYPRDSCAYPIEANVKNPPTDPYIDVAAYEAEIGGTVTLGAEGCIFSPPPWSTIVASTEQIGSGQWDSQRYLEFYHPGMVVADLLNVSGPDYADLPNSLDPLIPPDGRISRWEMYSWEKELGLLSDYPDMPYEGDPRCYKPTEEIRDQAGWTYDLPEPPAGLSTVDRRIMVMAVVNCGSMKSGKASTDRTKPHGNVGVFMIEPMGLVNPDTLYGELVDPRGLGISDIDVSTNLVRERLLLIE